MAGLGQGLLPCPRGDLAGVGKLEQGLGLELKLGWGLSPGYNRVRSPEPLSCSTRGPTQKCCQRSGRTQESVAWPDVTPRGAGDCEHQKPQASAATFRILL